MKKTGRYIWVIRAVAILVIFIIWGFDIFSRVIGGYARLGYSENGSFFLGNHGEFVETSETIWRISWIFDGALQVLYLVFFGCAVLILIIGLILCCRNRKKAFSQNRDPDNESNQKRDKQ